MKRLIFIFLLLTVIHLSAQKKNIPDSLRQIVLAARYHSGFIFAHNIHVQNTKGVHPDGFELEYAHQRTDSAIVTKFKCYPRSGFSFTYVDFNKTLLGKSYSFSYFLEPNYKLNDYLKMNVRATAGFSYLTNPYDAVKNPNLTVFYAVDNSGQRRKVVYNNAKLTDMERSESLALNGMMHDDYFECKTIQTKCPSKYKDDPKAAQKNLPTASNAK